MATDDQGGFTFVVGVRGGADEKEVEAFERYLGWALDVQSFKYGLLSTTFRQLQINVKCSSHSVHITMIISAFPRSVEKNGVEQFLIKGHLMV